MLSPPKPLDKIHPNLVCELPTWMGRATASFFDPAPLGPLGGVKRSNIIYFQLRTDRRTDRRTDGQTKFTKSSNIIYFQLQSNFKDFYTKLCVRSHKWKIHNRMFVLLPGSCPRGRTSGCWGLPGVGGGGKKKQDASKIFILGSNWWSWGEVKRSNIIKFWLPFLYQTLCVFSQIKVRKHIIKFG